MSPVLKEMEREDEPDEQTEVGSISGVERAYERPRLALDMDGVLANTKKLVYEILPGDYSMDDHTSWDHPVEHFGWETFIEGFEVAWTERWDEMEPCEEALPATVAELRDVFEVHIVTTQADDPEMMDGKRKWLLDQQIEYDDFVPVPHGKSKAELGYHVYIDDKPTLPKAVNEQRSSMTQVYLRDQPYNQDAPGDYVRVESVEEALRHLVWGTTETNPEEELIILD